MNIEKLMRDILAFDHTQELPPDPEACLECAYHPTNLKHNDGGHCYMFKELPDTLCMAFKPIPVRTKQ